MFERFTERARHVVVFAEEEARELNHGYIGSEHVLLGLLREEEGVAARVLESLGVSVESVRSQLVRMIGRGEKITAGQIPLTPRAKKILELSLREAQALDHGYIGTEHILLGLARENEGVATRVLMDFGADSEEIRHAVIKAVNDSGHTGSHTREGSRAPRLEPGTRDIDSTWFDWLAGSLGGLATGIRQEHRRNPDSGDLLIVLATASDTVASEMLRELGLDPGRIADLAQTARQSRATSDPCALIEKVRRSKEDALDAQDPVLAARFRDKERILRQKLRSERAAAVEEIKVQLGLPERRAED